MTLATVRCVLGKLPLVNIHSSLQLLLLSPLLFLAENPFLLQKLFKGFEYLLFIFLKFLNFVIILALKNIDLKFTAAFEQNFIYPGTKKPLYI